MPNIMVETTLLAIIMYIMIYFKTKKKKLSNHPIPSTT
jgi:hypothetical protein